MEKCMESLIFLCLFVMFQINIQMSCTKLVATLSCNFTHMAGFVKLLNHRSKI